MRYPLPAVMVDVRGGSILTALVTGQAGLVGLGRVLEPVAAAGGMAMDAVQLAGLGAGAQPPLGVGVVLSQVAAVGIEVGILEPHQVEVIEVAVAGAKFMVTGDILAWQGAQVALRCSTVILSDDDEFDVRGDGWLAAASRNNSDVPRRGAVAGLAIDPGLGPGGVIAVGWEIVVLGKLADVAAKAGGIEGQRRSLQ